MATTNSATVVNIDQQWNAPNAVCAICLKNGKLVTATAARVPWLFVEYFVCAAHAERARGWDRTVAAAGSIGFPAGP